MTTYTVPRERKGVCGGRMVGGDERKGGAAEAEIKKLQV